MDVHDTPPLASPLATRRNGKMQACEPCRQRKVACDHGYPVCRRCSRRPNGRSACYYVSPGQDARSGATAPSGRPGHETWTSDSQSKGPVALEDKFWSSPAARVPSGFFGPTSFSAVYLETEASLAVQSPSAASGPMPSSETPLGETMLPSLAEVEEMTNRDQVASQLAVRVLQVIPTCDEIATASFRLRLHTNTNDQWMRMIGEKLVATTWETFGPYLRDRTNITKLREFGGMICINTRRIIKEDQDDPQAWLESFSGSNLRWEAVGMIFLCAALGELSASTSADPRRVVGRYTEYCSSCITLANMGGSSGSLMLSLLYQRSMLHAYLHGDTSELFSFPSSYMLHFLSTLQHRSIIGRLMLIRPRPSILEISCRDGCHVDLFRLPC